MENLLKNRDFAIFAVDSNNNGTMSYVIKDHQCMICHIRQLILMY